MMHASLTSFSSSLLLPSDKKINLRRQLPAQILRTCAEPARQKWPKNRPAQPCAQPAQTLRSLRPLGCLIARKQAFVKFRKMCHKWGHITPPKV
jgi:hypothetical protein